MGQDEARDEVREVVERELSDLHGMWVGAAAKEHNVFLQAISPQIAIGSKLSRQLTSRLGHKLAAMARSFAELRFGRDKVPQYIVADGVAMQQMQTGGGNDTWVYSDFDYDRAMTLSLDLVTKAKVVAKIGTDQWRGLYEEALTELREGPRVQPWSVQVDLVVLDPTVGFAELESGGMLDSSNAIGQPRKLVMAGLAYGATWMPLHFCTAYANAGEGKKIKGSLPARFLQDPDHQDGLLPGSAWWNRILPPPVDFNEFRSIFQQVAEEFEIAGPAE